MYQVWKQVSSRIIEIDSEDRLNWNSNNYENFGITFIKTLITHYPKTKSLPRNHKLNINKVFQKSIMEWTLMKSKESRRATRGRPPLLFFENRKKVHWFWKKGPNCVHPWVASSIQNLVLRVSREKNSKIFPCGAFFLVFLIKRLSKCPNSTKPPLP